MTYNISHKCLVTLKWKSNHMATEAFCYGSLFALSNATEASLTGRHICLAQETIRVLYFQTWKASEGQLGDKL